MWMQWTAVAMAANSGAGETHAVFHPDAAVCLVKHSSVRMPRLLILEMASGDHIPSAHRDLQ
jgi:hypothetical protein